MFGKLIIVVSACFFLTACGPQLPPLNFSVPNVGPSATKLDAEVKAITVSMARPDEATGKMAWGVETQAPYWQTAIEEALTKMAIFRDDSPRKFSLAVKVLKMDLPEFGGDFTTRTAARYELIDRATGGVVFTTDVNAKGTVPLSYAFVGVVRARESVNRSVQNNILQFLQQLETVNLQRPMFPSGITGSGNPAKPAGAQGAPVS